MRVLLSIGATDRAMWDTYSIQYPTYRASSKYYSTRLQSSIIPKTINNKIIVFHYTVSPISSNFERISCTCNGFANLISGAYAYNPTLYHLSISAWYFLNFLNCIMITVIGFVHLVPVTLSPVLLECNESCVTSLEFLELYITSDELEIHWYRRLGLCLWYPCPRSYELRALPLRHAGFCLVMDDG